jgi:lipid-A-disaccharide synthase
MKYYLVAGEASGDLHGSNLIRELKLLDKNAVIRCWGGDLMQAAGGELVKHYRQLAFMGFTEVIKNLGTILRNLRFCKEDILAFNPDALVLIDYPGFNLRIAKWAKAQGIKVIYYISPQVWAWKESRVKQIKETVDKMLVILPFEEEFYNKWGYKTEYTGHPLADIIENYVRETPEPSASERNVIALLPGSRKQEILKKLPVMLRMAAIFKGHQFVVAKAPAIEDEFYDQLLKGYENVTSVRGQTYGLLRRAKAALVTSGTATLETALFGVPQIVCYKGSSISYQIAKLLIKVKYISLVNLIMNKEVVKELIQNDYNETNLERELKEIIYNEERIRQIKSDYSELKQLLNEGGNASNKAATSIVKFISGSVLKPG